MALNFPNSPSLNDTYTLGDKSWIYTGYGWRLQVTQPADVTVSSFATTSNGSVSTFNLDFEPVNEESLIVSLDGVLQEPTSAYTVSGNVITFASAPASTVNVVVTSFYTDVATYSVEVAAGVQTTAENAYAHANGAFDLANTALVSADIGSTVQAYDADTTKNDVTNTFTVDQLFSANVGIGTTSFTTGNFVVNPGGAGSPPVSISQTGDSPYLEFQRWTGNASDYYGLRIQSGIGNLAFLTAPSAAIGSQTFTERMRLTSAGGLSFGSSGTAYGTTGQVLTSNGNAPPSWEDASGGITTGKAIAMAIVFG